MEQNVCVVGAGIIGLSVATHLLEAYPNHFHVTVVADRFTPDTTASDRTGGLFIPPSACFPCPDVVTAKRWVSGTLKRFERLVDEFGGKTVGIKRAKGCYSPLPSQTIWWKDIIADFQKASDDDLCDAHLSTTSEGVYSFTSYIVNGTMYLSWLLDRFKSLGGTIQKQFVSNLSELPHDIIINCTGLGARDLVNDTEVYPSKGHLLSIHAPFVKHWAHTTSAYIFTRNDDIVLGTTAEIGKEDLEVSNLCIERILDRCKAVIPSLGKAHVNKYWTGVRPMRASGVRLEKECLSANGGTDRFVIHCYGHGSYGVTLSWGCAENVGDIVGQCFKIKKHSFLSKI